MLVWVSDAGVGFASQWMVGCVSSALIGLHANQHTPFTLSHCTAPPVHLHVQRGGGTDQPIMRTVAAEVARGRWVHIFPEGKVGGAHLCGAWGWECRGLGLLVYCVQSVEK